LLLGADEQNWISYSPPDGNFSVLLPEKPEEDDAAIPGGSGRLLTASFGEGGPVCIVTYHNLDESLRTRKAADAFLRGVETGLSKQGARATEPTREFMLGPVPGKEIVGAGFQDRFFRCRTYAVGRRAYQVIVVSDDPQGRDSKEAMKLLNSFQILNLPAKPFDEGNEAERIGYLVGRAFGGILVVVAIVYFATRRKKKPTSASDELPG
jgi:hypothetical protein